MKRTKIMSLILSASILTGNIGVAAYEDTGEALLEERTKVLAENFVCDYYSSLYLNSEMKLENRTEYDELAEYIRTKLDYLQYRTSEVENFNVSVEVKDKEIVEKGTLFTIWAEASFNYIGSENPSGFGRTVEVLVGSDNKIADMWINDGIEDSFREEGIKVSNVIWETKDEADERICEISLIKQSFIDAEQKQIKNAAADSEAVLTDNSVEPLAASSLTSTQRSNMVTYALNNVVKISPSSGNSSLVANYWDMSGADKAAGDCTNFVSHCMLAGGAVFNAPSGYKTGKINPNSSYWYYHNTDNRASSWSDVETFYSFITNNTGKGPKGAYKVFSGKYASNHGYEAIIGDVVQIDYPSKNNYNHTMIITEVTFEGGYWNVHLTGRSGHATDGEWYDKNTKFSETRFENEKNMIGCKYRSIHLTSLT